MLRIPALILLLVLALAVPGSAFAQNAGDDQYQDPFGDAPAQSDDGGLSDTPPGGGSGGSGNSGGSGGEAGSSGAVPPPAPAPEGAPSTEAAPTDALPNTGSDARLLALLGLSMLMIGVGLRLRTIHPDAY